jgi:PAS domain S-box-containing protein
MANKAQTAQAFDEAQYRQLLEQVPAITYIAERGADGRWHYVSPQIEHILGFTPAEWMADPLRWRKQVHPDDLELALAGEQTLSKEGDRYRVEYRLRTRDGKDVWVRDEALYVRQAETGKLILRGLFLDITERKQAEEELRKIEQRLQTTVNAAPLVVFALDAKGVFTLSMGKGLQALGLSPGEIVGRSVFDVYSDLPQVLEYARRALAGEELSVNVELPRLQLVYETRWSPLRDSAGNLLGTIGVATDITERVRLQAQLHRMQQLEAIGRLAGGIAHDFNNLMSIVLGHAELLSAQSGLSEQMKSGLSQVRRAAERAAQLTHQLLAFSRKQVLQPEIVNLNEIVADVQKMLARVIGEDIELVSRLHPSLAWVKADPVQMEQVLMNLAVNARDAMPQGGTLLIETSNVELDEAHARQHPDFPAGPCVMCAVSDTGHGMDQETMEHIFEPFFTTKEAGKGTGMGLATVYGIVTQSGGNLSVSSVLGQGTTFRVYLPAETAPAETRVEPPAETVAGGTETILLVEDEANLREITRIFLQSYGYRVLEATDVEEAVRIAKTFAEPIHLTLTDVIMPRMSGHQLVEQIIGLRPGMKVVYMTGYTDDMVVQHKVLEPGVALLAKPFDKFQLARKIRLALDGF